MNRHRARKRFGQHFLTDPGVIDAIVHAIGPEPEDLIVEIGPGHGAITAPLSSRSDQLHCIELDRDLAAELRESYRDNERVVIHEADALDFDFGSLGQSVDVPRNNSEDKPSDRPLRIVGNLPYNISTPLLFHLLDFRDRIRDMHFMLQKEVVDRISATPGSKDYGRLSIMLGCYLEAEALFDVDRRSFQPPPTVTSAVLRLCPLPRGSFDIEDHEALSRLVATAFSQRRKTLRNALKQVAGESDFAALDIDPTLRPEQLAIDKYVALSNRLTPTRT